MGKIMNKSDKILLVLTLFIVGILIFGLIIFPFIINYLFPRAPATQEEEEKFLQNTYVEKSNVSNLYFAIKFKDENITLKNIFNYTNNMLNGYPVINSTIIKNSTVNTTKIGTIVLQGSTKLTLQNLNLSYLDIYLYGNSTLIAKNVSLNNINFADNVKIELDNCTIYELRSFSSATIESSSNDYNVYILTKNTHIQFFSVFSPGTYIFNLSSIGLINSGINSQQMNLYIVYTRYSKIINTFNFNSLINISCYNCSLSQLNIYDNTILYCKNCLLFATHTIAAFNKFNIKTIFDNCNFSNNVLYYGIQADTDNLIINQTGIYGNYENNTIIQNPKNLSGYVPIIILIRNNTILNISQSDTFYLIYAIDNATIYSKDYHNTNAFGLWHIFLFDESKLNFNNVSILNVLMSYSNFISINQYDNSIVEINNTVGIFVYINQQGQKMHINNSNISRLYINPQNPTLSCNRYLKNTSLDFVSIFGSNDITFDNCSINQLIHGLYLYDGELIYNTSGFYGTTHYFNRTTLINTKIIQHELINFEINSSSAKLNILNIYLNLTVFIEKGKLYIFNSTIAVIFASNYSYIELLSCKIGYDQYSLLFSGLISLTNNCSSQIINCSLNQIGLSFNSSANIMNNSHINAVSIIYQSMASIIESTVQWVDIISSIPKYYACVISHSNINTVRTSGW